MSDKLVRAQVVITADAVYEHPSYAELGEEERDDLREIAKEAINEALSSYMGKWRRLSTPRVTSVVLDAGHLS